MPLVYAGVLGTALSVARIELPPYASAAVTLAGQMAVPLMLIMLGGALAQLGIRSAQRALALSAVRLGMGVAVGWLVASLLDLHDVARATLVLQSAMPAAVNSYVFAERWNAEPAEIAGLVVTSNGVACASIPLLLAMLGG
jgi:predicted permease